MVVSGRAHPALGAQIAAQLGVDLTPVTLKTFAAGEAYCRYEESVRGADVFVVQPVCANPRTGLGLNDAVLELLLLIEAARGASAHRVIAVTPWFGYARQDKKSAPREPLSARLFARLVETAGADRIVAMDLHAGQLQGFTRRPFDHVTALLMLTRHFAALDLPRLVVVAPDVGRAKLNQKVAALLGADLAILTKDRPGHQRAEVTNVIGDVDGRTAVIVDDIIDTAGTLRAAAGALRRAGARSVHAAATHAVLSGDAAANLADGFERVVVTDTIPLRPGMPPNVSVLPTAELLADCLRRIFVDASVSQAFDGENQLF
jgi:ribose-phosphate pyrophosphokinase